MVVTTDGEYRRVVERASQEEVTVDYANDLDTKRYAHQQCVCNPQIKGF